VSFLETAIASERIKQQLSEIRDTLRCTSSMADVPKLPNRKNSVFRIRRIHAFLGFPDPDQIFRGMDLDPDPSIIMQK
jgi:hypothetical protein